ncbi:hypothetical protein NDU88_004505 [Pleurodeles waltl]|uniref:Uncharacterized protein n=1 Tax=Pleurodeles waltl TaxID=8319 RepID=A0AAV7WS22_PLEWA|nr:hypothetical protein NDU88_004505 [Pleurodeles waltl]
MQVFPTTAEDLTSKRPGLSVQSFLLPDLTAAPTTRADRWAAAQCDPLGQASLRGSPTVEDRGGGATPPTHGPGQARVSRRPPARPAVPSECASAPGPDVRPASPDVVSARGSPEKITRGSPGPPSTRSARRPPSDHLLFALSWRRQPGRQRRPSHGRRGQPQLPAAMFLPPLRSNLPCTLGPVSGSFCRVAWFTGGQRISTRPPGLVIRSGW